VKTFNLYGDDWDRAEDRPGWRSKDGWVGARLDAELLGGSLYELEPGDRLWPYHLHHANEEWLIVVRGRPTLRSPDGAQELEEGDVVVFPRGKTGAHQVSNTTAEPIRVLMLSSMNAPDIVEYPDSGKVGAHSVAGVTSKSGLSWSFPSSQGVWVRRSGENSFLVRTNSAAPGLCLLFELCVVLKRIGRPGTFAQR
jgi:uncharacterized cupin superfamily protein